MADFVGAEALKNFPILQLIVGGVVALVGIVLTLRGAKENKKDAHIAPVGHDPYGLVVFANQALSYQSLIAERMSHVVSALYTLNLEQARTSARIEELKDVHEAEMDRLREIVERQHAERRPRH